MPALIEIIEITVAKSHSFIITFYGRYLDLTDEEKEKLRGSYKVARKLDKLEGRNQDRFVAFLFCVAINAV